MSYYFLAASLPMLSLGEPPPIDMTEFLSRCGTELSDPDMQALRDLLEGRESDSPFASQWHARDRQIRNAIARQRGIQSNRDASRFLMEHAGFDVASDALVEELMGRANPLEKEMGIDRLRWRVLDEIAGLDMFSPAAIMAYGVKLQIAHRWAALDEQAGHDKLDEIVDEQMAQSVSIEHAAGHDAGGGGISRENTNGQ